MEMADRQVSFKEGQDLATKWGCPFVECSGKTGENTREVFHMLIKEIEKDGELLGADESIGACNIL